MPGSGRRGVVLVYQLVAGCWVGTAQRWDLSSICALLCGRSVGRIKRQRGKGINLLPNAFLK